MAEERIVRDELTERGGEPYRELEVEDGEYWSELGWRVSTESDLIAACREIVARESAAEVDGVLVDLFSASAVVTVYDALSVEHRAHLLELADGDMAHLGALCWRVIGKAREAK